MCPLIELRMILDEIHYGNVQQFMNARRDPRSPFAAECEGW